MTDINRNNYILYIIVITAVAGIVYKTYFYSPSTEHSPTDNQIVDIAVKSNLNKTERRFKPKADIIAEIKNRFTVTEYQKQLIQKKSKLQSDITKSDLVERILLDRELALLDIKIKNIEKNYTEKIDLLVELYLFLNKTIETHLLQESEKAKNNLLFGETYLAFNVLSKIKFIKGAGDMEAAVNRVANAAFLRGNIAQEQLDYERAYRLYRQAVMTTPHNISYLTTAGDSANDIALYSNAIDYFEAALYHLKKNTLYREKHSRNLWIKLGTAWNSKGESSKAIKYFELALASDMKTYGRQHINIAVDKNRLGVAWESKGNIKKAIQYYRQALNINRQHLGMNHETSLKIAENLQAAKLLQK